jgi:transporter family protein
VILQLVAALLGVILLAFLMLTADKSFKLNYDRNGLIWSVAAGLSVGLAEMLSFCVSGLGVPATQSIPVIIGGSVMFGAILGVILLGEKLMLHGWSGILTLVIGIVCIALDPGEKVEEGGVDSDIVSIDKPPVYWILIALICANAYAFYNIFIKKGSSSIDPILGGTKLTSQSMQNRHSQYY